MKIMPKNTSLFITINLYPAINKDIKYWKF